VNCTLTQSFSKVRKDTGATDYQDADHLHENFGDVQTIVTSSGREDSGLFQLDFRDERYLPFEGTGAISRWQIQLPRESNHFDVGTVSDVVLHIRYTARDGGEALRDAARTTVKDALSTGTRLFDAKSDFASEWYRFKHPEQGQRAKLVLELGDEHFPFHSPEESIGIDSVELICAMDERATSPLTLNVEVGGQGREYPLASGTGPEGLRTLEKRFDSELGDVVISGKLDDISPITELVLLCRYTLK
jgi:hypothetical protein